MKYTWKQYSLGELFSFTGGLGISREQLGNRGIPYLHYGDMHKDNFSYVSYDNYVALPKYDIKINGDECFLLKDGDVVFLDASEDLTGTSRCVVVDNPDNKPFIAGLHTFIARPLNNSLSKWYKKYFTQTQMVQKQFEHLAVGIKVYTVNRNDIKKIIVSFPKSIKEQQKIAKILTKWDDAIELQKQLIEKLELQKNELMQKLLKPKKDWLNYKLKALCNKIQSGGTPKTNNTSFYGGNIPFVKIDDITNSGKYLYDTNTKITPSGLQNSSAWLVPEDSLLYSMYASVGYPIICKCKVATSQAIMCMCIKNEIVDLEYLYYFLLKHQPKMVKYIEKGTQGNLNANIVNNILITMPCINKQKMIGKYLAKQDELISLHSQKLDLLTYQRKALMQRLLTGAIRVKV